MARYPGAVWKPITASKGRDRLTVYNRVNLHSTASTARSQFDYFNQPGIPDSHFHVAYDGEVEQYVDTDYQAFADLEGNDATISVETQGVSVSTGDEEWRPAQILAIIKLTAWIIEEHDIPRKLATNSWAGSPTSLGLSWHRLGCDGNFPAMPSIQAGRSQRGGGMRYTKHFGKVCPGYKRIAQIHQDVWPGVQRLLNGGTLEPATPEKEGFLMALDDNEQKAVLWNVREIKKLLEDDSTLWNVRQIRKQVDGLVRTNELQTAAIATLATSAGLDPAVVTAAIEKALKDVTITLTNEAE